LPSVGPSVKNLTALGGLTDFGKSDAVPAGIGIAVVASTGAGRREPIGRNVPDVIEKDPA